jgi:hypothetical protein
LSETQAPRYIRQHWAPRTNPLVAKGDYVVATKYSDGDPGDQFCIGFYNGSYDHYGQTRHLVVDGDGNNFRHNGFRRVARVGAKRGTWMVEHLTLIEAAKDRFSVWHWYRAPWRELNSIGGTRV